MKTIYLMRHAKSSREDPALPDRERTLTERGQKDALLMATVLKDRHVQVDALIASPAIRALTTANIVADQINVPQKNIRVEPTIYNADVGDLVDIVEGVDDALTTIMIIGHNPGLTWFADYLVDDLSLNLSTSAVCEIDHPCAVWTDLEERSGTCVWHDSPKNYK